MGRHKRDGGKRPFLPILIIPGFMSSGLEVVESDTKESWVGKRVWLNLKSLGFQSTWFGNAKDDYTDISFQLAGGGSTEDDDEKEVEPLDEQPGESPNESPSAMDARRAVLRNAWLHHMALDDDMVSERDGVRVRNIAGLAGVDYLTEQSFLKFVSYVFGPMIRALRHVGYEDGVNLDAAPYDWRLPPSALETRDKYFTRTLDQIEKMYLTNKNTPIVLVAHSMGCKIGHYLLNFAKETRGQEWTEKHVHTFCPIGAPHLGAPKALRSLVSGDKMGLEKFLSDTEARVLGRSWGSGPYLVPSNLPDHATPCATMRMEGAIEVTLLESIDSDAFLCNREAGHTPDKLRVTVVFNDSGVTTDYATINERQRVSFNETFTFRTPADGPKGIDRLTIFLCEPGISRARRSNTSGRRAYLQCRKCFFSPWKNCCGEADASWWRPSKDSKILYILNLVTFWWLVFPIIRYGLEIGIKMGLGLTYGVLWCLFSGTTKFSDKIVKKSGGSSVLAVADVCHLRKELFGGEFQPDGEMQIELDLDLISYRDMRRLFACCFKKRKCTVKVRVKWIPPESLAHHRSRCRHIMCQPSPQSQGISGALNAKKWGKAVPYAVRSGYDLLHAEGLLRVFDHMDKMYANDPLDPRGCSSEDPPPVRNIKAIYGVNRPTEVGAIYRRQRAVIGTRNRVRNIFKLDHKVVLKFNTQGLLVKDGCIYETTTTGRKTGDGTVPYWSLSHVKSWENDCQVTVDELDGAEHREILADKRLHKILVDYCCAKDEVPEDKV